MLPAPHKYLTLLITIIITTIRDLIRGNINQHPEFITTHTVILQEIIIHITTLINITLLQLNIRAMRVTTLNVLTPSLVASFNFFKLLFLLFVSLLISACEARYPYVDKEKTDSYLYDKVGFDTGKAPQNAANPVITKIAPDRYYRQPTNPELMPQNQQPQQQQQWQQPQQPYPYYVPQVTYPYQPQPYYQQHEIRKYNLEQQQDAGSRFYSNPYSIPPTTHQAPRYDGDQFYSPPVSQSNQEPILDPSEFNRQ
jgi:hypothetical protein